MKYGLPAAIGTVATAIALLILIALIVAIFTVGSGIVTPVIYAAAESQVQP